MSKVLITVQGGVADLVAAPPDVTVEIRDFDNDDGVCSCKSCSFWMEETNDRNCRQYEAAELGTCRTADRFDTTLCPDFEQSPQPFTDEEIAEAQEGADAQFYDWDNDLSDGEDIGDWKIVEIAHTQTQMLDIVKKLNTTHGNDVLVIRRTIYLDDLREGFNLCNVAADDISANLFDAWYSPQLVETHNDGTGRLKLCLPCYFILVEKDEESCSF